MVSLILAPYRSRSSRCRALHQRSGNAAGSSPHHARTLKRHSRTLAHATVLSLAGRLSCDVPYAPVNGLNMYYEIHGEGPPLAAPAPRWSGLDSREVDPVLHAAIPSDRAGADGARAHCRPRRSSVPLPRHGRGHGRADAPARDRERRRCRLQRRRHHRPRHGDPSSRARDQARGQRGERPLRRAIPRKTRSGYAASIP